MCRLLIVLCDWKRVQTYDLVVPGWGQRFEETVFCCFVLNCFFTLSAFTRAIILCAGSIPFFGRYSLGLFNLMMWQLQSYLA